MKHFAFPKAEHICLRSDIESLFSHGSKWATAYPVKAVFRLQPLPSGTPAVKVLLSVSKRKLRHAVSRNRAKRQLREAYRLNKDLVCPSVPSGQCLHIGFIWCANTNKPSEAVARSVVKLLGEISAKISEADKPETTQE